MKYRNLFWGSTCVLRWKVVSGLPTFSETYLENNVGSGPMFPGAQDFNQFNAYANLVPRVSTLVVLVAWVLGCYAVY